MNTPRPAWSDAGGTALYLRELKHVHFEIHLFQAPRSGQYTEYQATCGNFGIVWLSTYDDEQIKQNKTTK